MNKTELIKTVSKRLGISIYDAEGAVRAVINIISNAPKTTLTKFGRFEWKTRAARVCVNPNTGERMIVPPKSVLTFTAAPAMKNRR